jgi:hypothetical protein|tara:strand:- start:56 stop:271 length:216 start_codon:yes stop_codon:yes gene_type:complete
MFALSSHQHQCSELIGFTQDTETCDDDAKRADRSAFDETLNEMSSKRVATKTTYKPQMKRIVDVTMAGFGQ